MADEFAKNPDSKRQNLLSKLPPALSRHLASFLTMVEIGASWLVSRSTRNTAAQYLERTSVIPSTQLSEIEPFGSHLARSFVCVGIGALKHCASLHTLDARYGLICQALQGENPLLRLILTNNAKTLRAIYLPAEWPRALGIS